MEHESTINQLLNGVADAPALGAPGAEWLSFGLLRELVGRTVDGLNAHGIGRGDRVALVVDNGPQMAAAFLAVAAGATAAPLNPAYRSEEFAFYLSDLGAKLLICPDGTNSPALPVAARLGIPIAKLRPTLNAGAGAFALAFPEELDAASTRGGPAAADDVALVLHTSGTTSRPKIVPLSQRNVCASAYNVAVSTELGIADRGLNIMPLFHIHGLIAGLLAPLSVGGSVSCTPGFNALKFFGWLDEVSPSWYTSVPTMHQAILARAGRNAESVARSRLRFIRSSSASLPPQVLKELEATFRAPVVEAYGMTEAAHQMTANPLPPRTRKPGTVGVAAGLEVVVLDPDGHSLPWGSIGEIAIRGANVTAGYEANPEANASAFIGGWFRTGDQGVIDALGYLTITGRLKEIINRGGEKVSPREVDEALMEHPAVAQCATFAMPHDKLGEDVAAAVVLRENCVADESGLRTFASERLANFKVPRRIVILDEIPKGATGKVQRIGLAEKLGLA